MHLTACPSTLRWKGTPIVDMQTPSARIPPLDARVDQHPTWAERMPEVAQAQLIPGPLVHLLLKQPDHLHALRVAQLAARSAAQLSMDPGVAHAAGMVHDIGKLAVPRVLLTAPRPLTADEFAVVRQHAAYGAQMVRRLWPDCPPTILHAITHHHERLHGRGYPHGLTCLPPLTALIATCDVWDALTHHRPYRQAISSAAAAGLIRGEGLPGEIVEAVLRTAGGCEPHP